MLPRLKIFTMSGRDTSTPTALFTRFWYPSNTHIHLFSVQSTNHVTERVLYVTYLQSVVRLIVDFGREFYPLLVEGDQT